MRRPRGLVVLLAAAFLFSGVAPQQGDTLVTWNKLRKAIFKKSPAMLVEALEEAKGVPGIAQSLIDDATTLLTKLQQASLAT